LLGKERTRNKKRKLRNDLIDKKIKEEEWNSAHYVDGVIIVDYEYTDNPCNTT